MTSSGNDVFLIGNSEVMPGTTQSVQVSTGLELHDGYTLSCEVIIVHGSQPGPVAYIGSGVHGDEPGAVAITANLIPSLDPQSVSGTVIVVPVQNPLAYRSQHRLPISLLLHSPLDQGNVNVFQSYPGDPQGNTMERLAHFLFDTLISRADLLMDLHTPTTGGRYLPFAFVPPAELGTPAKRARGLAEAFGVHAILAASGTRYNSESTPHVCGVRRGIAGFGVEMGEGGRVDEEHVAEGVAGVRRVLSAAGMLDQEKAAPSERPAPVDLQGLLPVRASRAGLLHVRPHVGARVSAEEPIADITNTKGEVVERIQAPADGIVLRLTTFAVVSTGEQVVQLGILR